MVEGERCAFQSIEWVGAVYSEMEFIGVIQGRSDTLIHAYVGFIPAVGCG